MRKKKVASSHQQATIAATAASSSKALSGDAKPRKRQIENSDSRRCGEREWKKVDNNLKAASTKKENIYIESAPFSNLTPNNQTLWLLGARGQKKRARCGNISASSSDAFNWTWRRGIFFSEHNVMLYMEYKRTILSFIRRCGAQWWWWRSEGGWAPNGTRTLLPPLHHWRQGSPRSGETSVFDSCRVYFSHSTHNKQFTFFCASKIRTKTKSFSTAFAKFNNIDGIVNLLCAMWGSPKSRNHKRCFCCWSNSIVPSIPIEWTEKQISESNCGTTKLLSMHSVHRWSVPHSMIGRMDDESQREWEQEVNSDRSKEIPFAFCCGD